MEKPVKPPLMDHQVKAIKYALKNPYAVLALDPRLGKSRCAIEIREEKKLPCVIVCPSYLIDNWKMEIRKWCDSRLVFSVHTGRDILKFGPIFDFDYVIISYDLAKKAESIFERAKMIVLDEAPAIKSMKAKRSEFLHRVVFENSPECVLLLTGTPIKNRVQEFYSLLAMCYYDPRDPSPEFLKKFPDEITFADHFAFREEYTVRIDSYRTFNVVKFVGIQNVEELRKWLKPHYIRIRDSEVLDMPEVSIKPILVSDVDDGKLLSAFHGFFEEDESIPWEERKREDQVSSVMPEHKAMAALKKVPFTVKYVEDLLEEVECCLIYTDHRESAHALAKEFKTTAITGELPSQKRGMLADKFQAGEGKVLVATIGSLKEGKSLHRANNIVFNDLAWVPGDLKQVHNRIRAIGKKHKCVIHRIFGSPQDSYIADTLDAKLEVIEKAT